MTRGVAYAREGRNDKKKEKQLCLVEKKEKDKKLKPISVRNYAVAYVT